MASRPKQPKYARNKNILVIGGSGSRKTRFFCKPSLLQAHSSFVVTDPKETLLPEIGTFLERKKYRIKCLNLINFKKSMRYNPLAYIRSEKDIMGEETLSLYATYMSTLGNREDLFPGSSYVDKYTNPPATYDIPASALEDETFAALITEAEKYIGYPYVWGGSNPNTSFDCSGFVSWALTESGVYNTGRLGAQGLYNISTPVSSANARPGDLIFFVGTYDTPGVSHVGIYVGGGKMLHCGDPIQYADINTSYWRSHFYAFGRPPFD